MIYACILFGIAALMKPDSSALFWLVTLAGCLNVVINLGQDVDKP
jgi:hypothetical protein